jgi:parallel beta-helix repeat protein
VALGSSSGNSVSGNDITASEYEGIWLDTSSNNNSVSGNNITARNLVGIYLSALSNNNSVSANNIANNLYGGIFFDSSSNNSIVGNNIVNDSEGIYLEDSSGDNSIFHNDFVNNTQQVVSSVGFANVWDDGYPSGGNYWSDYNGTDSNGGPYQNQTGSDGIGDTAYVIDANNTDRFPLMGMFHSYNVTYFTLPMVGHFCEVTVISNSTISGFFAPIWLEHPEIITLTFNVTGTEGSTGFCRVTIPNVIIQNLWQGNYTVLVDGEPWPTTNWTDTTNTYIYFNYTQSEHQTVIIPELPSPLILPILMIMTLLAIVASRRKWSKHQARASFD